MSAAPVHACTQTCRQKCKEQRAPDIALHPLTKDKRWGDNKRMQDSDAPGTCGLQQWISLAGRAKNSRREYSSSFSGQHKLVMEGRWSFTQILLDLILRGPLLALCTLYFYVLDSTCRWYFADCVCAFTQICVSSYLSYPAFEILCQYSFKQFCF